MAFGTFFLTEPDLFPGRISGERWGDEESALRFPGGPYALRGLTPAQKRRIESRWEGEASANGRPEESPCEATLFRADPGDFRDVRLEEYRYDVEAEKDRVRVAGPGWIALLDAPETCRAGLFLPREIPTDFDGVVENFLRVVAAYRLLARGGVLLHSVAVVRHGVAHLFLGRSGAGKSTLAARSAADGLTVLSDELNVLERGPDGPRLKPVPFAGDFGRTARPAAESFPLASLYRLEKHECTALRPMAVSAAAAQLLVCAPFVNTDPHRREGLMGILEGLVSVVPCRVLEMALEGPLWEVIP